MKVKELKELLNKFDDEQEVRIAVYSAPTDIAEITEETILVDRFGGEHYDADRNYAYLGIQKKKVIMLNGYDYE